MSINNENPNIAADEFIVGGEDDVEIIDNDNGDQYRTIDGYNDKEKDQSDDILPAPPMELQFGSFEE